MLGFARLRGCALLAVTAVIAAGGLTLRSAITRWSYSSVCEAEYQLPGEEQPAPVGIESLFAGPRERLSRTFESASLRHIEKTQTQLYRETDRAVPDQFFTPANVGIPKLIHQTWKTKELPEWVKNMQTVKRWKEENPGYTHKLWTDEEAASFVKEHYTYLYNTFLRLRPVERADFFRYAVIHKYGGYYADIDVECIRRLDDWDTGTADMVVGIEAEFDTFAAARKRKFARQLQYVQWVFAARPGHPVLADALQRIHFNLNYRNVSKTLEMTGPGVFTDSVQAFINAGCHNGSLLVLPGDAFACCGGWGNAAIPVKATRVRHFFRGSWKGFEHSGGQPKANLSTNLTSLLTPVTDVHEPLTRWSFAAIKMLTSAWTELQFSGDTCESTSNGFHSRKYLVLDLWNGFRGDFARAVIEYIDYMLLGLKTGRTVVVMPCGADRTSKKIFDGCSRACMGCFFEPVSSCDTFGALLKSKHVLQNITVAERLDDVLNSTSKWLLVRPRGYKSFFGVGAKRDRALPTQFFDSIRACGYMQGWRTSPANTRTMLRAMMFRVACVPRQHILSRVVKMRKEHQQVPRPAIALHIHRNYECKDDAYRQAHGRLRPLRQYQNAIKSLETTRKNAYKTYFLLSDDPMYAKSMFKQLSAVGDNVHWDRSTESSSRISSYKYLCYAYFVAGHADSFVVTSSSSSGVLMALMSMAFRGEVVALNASISSTNDLASSGI